MTYGMNGPGMQYGSPGYDGQQGRPNPAPEAPSPQGVAALFGLTAALGVLTLVLPLSSVFDGKLLDGGFLMVVLFGLPAALLVVAAVGSGKAEMRALGTGAAIFTGLWMLSLAVAIWVTSEGEGLGAGSYVLTLTPIAALIAVIRALPSVRSTVAPPVAKLAFGVGVVMSIGQTLVPSSASDNGVTWAQFNSFGEYQKPAIGVAMLAANAAPAIVLLLALKKGGRAGAMVGLGGALTMAVANVCTQLELFDRENGFQTVRTLVHPVALIASLVVIVLLFVGLSTTASAASPMAAGRPTFATNVGGAPANPARWAPDPLGRHQLRYWDGGRWTEHVSNGGVQTLDAVTTSASPVTPTMVQPVVAAQPVVASQPTSAFAPPTAPVPLAPVQVPPAPSHALDATVDRTVIRGMRTDVPAFTVTLDDGTTSQHRGVLLIGRDPSARPTDVNPSFLPISDSTMSVSKSHLALGRDGGGFWVQDLGSTNGSAVQTADGRVIGVAADEVHRVPQGARIMIGDRWLEVR